MRKKILTGLILGGLFIAHNTFAQEKKTVFHFKMDKGSTPVTYAAGAETIPAINNKAIELHKNGSPVFSASAPSGKQGGSMLFSLENRGHYYNEEITFSNDENFIFEVWVKAANPGKDAKHTFGVAGIGSQEQGCQILTRGFRWFVTTGDGKRYDIGTVITDAWTHLALVVEDDQCNVWMNGEKVKKINSPSSVAPGVFVGSLIGGRRPLVGEIYEVRYSAFPQGTFDPETAFLLNLKKEKQRSREQLAARRSLIEEMMQPKRGCIPVDLYEEKPVGKDYLIHEVNEPSKLFVTDDPDEASAKMILTNGLISRTFYVADNLCCISYKNLYSGAEYLRAAKPEARLMINDRWIEVGGLTGQTEQSYLLEKWLPEMVAIPGAWVFTGITTQQPKPRYHWEQKFNAREAEWPPKGLHVILHFKAPETETEFKGLNIDVHYELYDGIPVLTKWITLDNQTGKDIVVEKTETEIIAINQDQTSRIHMESDYSCAIINASPRILAINKPFEDKPYRAGKSTTLWEPDPDYYTWATHNQAEDRFLDYPNRKHVLKSRVPLGPSEKIEAGKTFNSFITFELLLDSDDTERNGLAHRRMYRTLAPQVTESLLQATPESNSRDAVKLMLRQMGEVGFERFHGRRIAYDNLDPENVAFWKEMTDYATERGIIMGAYELVVASRNRGADINCVDPETGEPGSRFGQSVCVASKWSDQYFPDMFTFLDRTGFRSWDADGPYHGDVCASTVHKHHRGLNDSQWEQWKIQIDVIHELQRRNCYVPIPDWYFLNGQSSTGMGYREATANLPQNQQLLLQRQYIYDGTFHKIPTMGWINMELSKGDITLEPLEENLEHYENALMQYLGSGAQFGIRAKRLYDTPKTKAMVKKCVDWYKKYREVLTGDIIHLGRPNGRDLDCMMHVNPFGKDKAMVMVFNPTDRKIKKEITIPLYYSGLKGKAAISEKEKSAKQYPLDNEGKTIIDVSLEAGDLTWFLIRETQ